MPNRTAIPLAANAKVDDSPTCPVGATWPMPVHQRLEELVTIARARGERTTKRELLAAIVCAFDPDTADIEATLKHYRLATVQEVALRRPTANNVVEIDRFGPGRRTGTGGPQ